MRWIACLFLFFASSIVFAEDVSVDLNWTAPTTYEDGSALPSTEIQGYRIYYSIDSAITDKSGSYFDVGSTQTYSGTISLTTGIHTVYFRAATLATNGQESTLSNEVSKTYEVQLVPKIPSPPSSLEFASVVVTCVSTNPSMSCVITEIP